MIFTVKNTITNAYVTSPNLQLIDEECLLSSNSRLNFPDVVE